MSGGRSEAYDSLTASRIARSRFLQGRSSSRRRVDGGDTTSNDLTVVRAAGRFSVPSDDIVLSPTRRRKTTADTPAKPHTAPDTTPSPRAARASIPDKSFWPALDPEGHPVRWQIRDPFVFDIGPGSSQEVETKASGRSRTADAEARGRAGDAEARGRAVRRVRSKSQKRVRSVSKKPVKEAEKIRKSPRSRRRAEAPKVVYHWRRMFLALGVCVAVLAGTIHPSSRQQMQRTLSGTGGRVSLVGRVALRRAISWAYGPTYCSTYETPWDDPDCEPCPENAVCENGSMRCRKPQFKERWVNHRWICERDNVKYRAAERLLQRVADFLARQNGYLQCGNNVHPEAVQLAHPEQGTIAGFTLCSIEHLVIEWQKNQRGGVEEADAARFLLLEELLLDDKKCGVYGLVVGRARATDLPSAAIAHRDGATCGAQQFTSAVTVALWYSTSSTKPTSCLIIQSVSAYLPALSGALLGFLTLRFLWYRWWTRRCTRTAIKRIVEENTSIRTLAAGSGKGYAIGPRAQDIISMMRGPEQKSTWFTGLRRWWGEPQPSTDERRAEKLRSMSGDGMARSYPEYSHLSQYLSDKDVEKFCEDLVKVDPSFCRSVLAMDMIPFYYSKNVIDRLRFNTYSAENQKQQ